MDFQDYEKQWADLLKEVKKDAPVDKDLVSELGGVQGALKRLNNTGGELGKLAEDLRKALILSISAADSATKEVAAFTSVAKKLGKSFPLGPDTDKELEKFAKAAKALREATGKFENQAD